MHGPFLLCAAITAVSACVSLGFSVAAWNRATGFARTLALYTSVRSLALVIASFVPLFNDSVDWLRAVSIAMVLVQAGDALVGFTIQERMKTWGPAGTAVANLAALLWLTL